jgi:hypothetical protein
MGNEDETFSVCCFNAGAVRQHSPTCAGAPGIWTFAKLFSACAIQRLWPLDFAFIRRSANNAPPQQ